MKYDTLIIGAGLSGLAAGVRLAHFEKKVAICERHFREGGLNSFYHRHGVMLETGLHAMTNFAPRGANKNLPLMKLLRQLRIPYDALLLREQNGSAVAFPGVRLHFNNNFAELTESIATAFPAETDNFLALDHFLLEYDATRLANGFESGKALIRQYLRDPLLADMFLCPLLFYGSAVENDIDLGQLALLHRSIYREGFCRPAGEGIKEILDQLKQRFLESGGELKMNCSVREICLENGRATGVMTATGEFFAADNILSSCGAPETNLLCSASPEIASAVPPGQLAFLESIAVMNENYDSGTDRTVIFFSNSKQFDYRSPSDLCSDASGVICLPRNFRFQPGEPRPEPMIRVTAPAGYEAWNALEKTDYPAAKEKCAATVFVAAEKILGCRDIVGQARFTDTITPLTLWRYTGRLNGAIYGSPTKLKDGRTAWENVYVCGTDQGFLGITGAMLSGISIANQYLLG